jgi:hypothetical protein
MEDSRMIRLPSHVTRPGDEGLWKEIRSYKTDRGKTLVRWLRCPMSYRFGCKCQIKIYDGEHYIALPNFIWDAIMTRHPKSLAACMLLDVEDKAEIFDTTMHEIFRLGADTLPLHLKLGLWHAELIRTKSKPVLKREELKVVVMPRQQWLYKLDPDNSRSIQE